MFWSKEFNGISFFLLELINALRHPSLLVIPKLKPKKNEGT